MQETKDLADLAIASGLTSDSLEATLVRMIALRAMGFHPIVSLKDLVLHAGALHPSPTLIGSLIYRTGVYQYRVNAANHGAQVEFLHNERNLGMASYGVDDAQRDGASQFEVFKSHPQELFAARALVRGARYHLPHLFTFTPSLPDEVGMIPEYEPTRGWSYREREAA